MNAAAIRLVPPWLDYRLWGSQLCMERRHLDRDEAGTLWVMADRQHADRQPTLRVLRTERDFAVGPQLGFLEGESRVVHWVLVQFKA